MRVVGTGFACLDIIDKELETVVMNGGTCANVLTVLAQLGENVNILLPKYAYDQYNANFYNTLSKLNVNVIEFCTTRLNIPRIIESYNLDNKEIRHVFHTKCPKCQKNLMKNRLIKTDESNNVMDLILDNDILFVDRVSDGIKNIASRFNDKDKMVFFEPNSGRNLNAIIAMSQISDVVKFSTDKISICMAERILERCKDSQLNLVIATQGENGMMFSYRTLNGSFTKWIRGPHIAFENTKDTSGVGDWLTAGFLHFWAKNKFKLEEKNIFIALEQGLRLSNICSGSEGAQGPLYEKESFEKLKGNYNIKLQHELERIAYVKQYSGEEQCVACLMSCEQ